MKIYRADLSDIIDDIFRNNSEIKRTSYSREMLEVLIKRVGEVKKGKYYFLEGEEPENSDVIKLSRLINDFFDIPTRRSNVYSILRGCLKECKPEYEEIWKALIPLNKVVSIRKYGSDRDYTLEVKVSVDNNHKYYEEKFYYEREFRIDKVYERLYNSLEEYTNFFDKAVKIEDGYYRYLEDNEFQFPDGKIIDLNKVRSVDIYQTEQPFEMYYLIKLKLGMQRFRFKTTDKLQRDRVAKRLLDDLREKTDFITKKWGEIN